LHFILFQDKQIQLVKAQHEQLLFMFMEQKKCEARIDNYTAPTSGKIGDFVATFRTEVTGETELLLFTYLR
jgi:hypothetical protein